LKKKKDDKTCSTGELLARWSLRDAGSAKVCTQ